MTRRLCQTKVIILLCNLGDGDCLGRSPVIPDIRVGIHNCSQIMKCHAHGVVKPRAHEVQFARTARDLYVYVGRQFFLCQGLHCGNQVLPAQFIIAPLQTTEAHVRKITRPFEI